MKKYLSLTSDQRLPPCGGSGLKLCAVPILPRFKKRLPPCGGSGLKCQGEKWVPGVAGLPPCGGSGLKCRRAVRHDSHGRVSLHAEGVD